MCMVFNYSYTCSSDKIRDVMINSCNILTSSESKILESLSNSFNYSLCCDADPSIVNICARYFCH